MTLVLSILTVAVLSIPWSYVVARMVSRAVIRSIREE